MQKSASKNAVVFPTDVPASEASYPTKLIIFHLEMTIFCSAWDEKWARVQNPLSLKMIEIKAWNHLEMNLMLVKQKKKCTTFVKLCVALLLRRRKKNRRLSFKKVARHFQMARMMTGLKIRSCSTWPGRPCSIWKGSDVRHVNLSMLWKCTHKYCFFYAIPIFTFFLDLTFLRGLRVF